MWGGSGLSTPGPADRSAHGHRVRPQPDAGASLAALRAGTGAQGAWGQLVSCLVGKSAEGGWGCLEFRVSFVYCKLTKAVKGLNVFTF